MITIMIFSTRECTIRYTPPPYLVCSIINISYSCKDMNHMVDKKTYVEENESNSNINNSTVGKRHDNDDDDAGATVASGGSSSSSSSPIIELEIQDIEGIGPTTAKK